MGNQTDKETMHGSANLPAAREQGRLFSTLLTREVGILGAGCCETQTQRGRIPPSVPCAGAICDGLAGLAEFERGWLR